MHMKTKMHKVIAASKERETGDEDSRETATHRVVESFGMPVARLEYYQSSVRSCSSSAGKGNRQSTCIDP